jgi:hypothetical protein
VAFTFKLPHLKLESCITEMIKYKGITAFAAEEQDKIKDLVLYIINKFFSKRLQKNLEITLIFKKDLYKTENIYGDCIWEDQHYKPREFTVRVDSSQKFNLVLNTIAHELTHVKQWAKGEMFELQRERKVYKFKKETFNTSKMDYWDLPWEIEANGRAIGLIVQWVDKACVEGTMKVKQTNKLLG